MAWAKPNRASNKKALHLEANERINVYLRVASPLIIDCFWIRIQQFLKIRQVVQCTDQKKSVWGSYSLDAS